MNHKKNMLSKTQIQHLKEMADLRVVCFCALLKLSVYVVIYFIYYYILG